MIHTDFRIYWPARIGALALILQSKDMELHVIEIAGTGSPYDFAKQEINKKLNWHVLFPTEKIEHLKGNCIKEKVFKQLDYLQPDVIIAGAIAFPSGALATTWAKMNKKKIIIFDDSKVEDVQRNTIVNYVKQHIYSCVDAVLYPSEDWDETGYFWKFKKEQLFYGVDVVDNEFWQQEIIENDKKKKYILSIGRQIPKKNFIFLLQAYKKYRTIFKEHSYDLILIGDGIEREEIKAYIIENKLDGVTLLPFMQQKELLPFYRYAEVFVLASKQDETWGLVINEAMASGLPIIASIKCGATHTLVKENINGYMFSPYSVEELTHKLVTFHQLSAQKKLDMKKESVSIIKEWGVERFGMSIYKAIEYVINRESSNPSLIDSILLKFWKGRYRPI